MPDFFKKVILVLLVFFASFVSSSPAQTSIKSKYFNTRIFSGIDRLELLKKIDAGYFLKRDVSSLGAAGGREGLDALIGSTLDAMYLQVSDIIDIHIYSMAIDLEVFPDRNALAATLENYLKRRVDAPSFYFTEKNKIYISFGDLDAGMLAHEMAHAIVCRYFAVPPPEKIQEVIAGYADYSIRKLVR